MVLQDVSKAWEWCQRWKLDQLILLGSVRSGADELREVWAELCTMTFRDWTQAKADMAAGERKLRLSRVPDVENLGDRPNLKKVWPLIEAAGCTKEDLKPVRLDGWLCRSWRFVPMESEPG